MYANAIAMPSLFRSSANAMDTRNVSAAASVNKGCQPYQFSTSRGWRGAGTGTRTSGGAAAGTGAGAGAAAPGAASGSSALTAGSVREEASTVGAPFTGGAGGVVAAGGVACAEESGNSAT